MSSLSAGATFNFTHPYIIYLGVLGLDGDADDGGDAELHGLHVVGGLQVGDGSSLMEGVKSRTKYARQNRFKQLNRY